MHISPPRCIVSKAYLSDSSLAPASRQKLKKETGFSPLKIVKEERKRKEMEEKNETRKKNVLHLERVEINLIARFGRLNRNSIKRPRANSTVPLL